MLSALLTLWLLVSPAVTDPVPPAAPGGPGEPEPAPIAARLPGLADFAEHGAVTGHEQAFLAHVEAWLPAGLHVERDALGSLIVRTDPPGVPVRKLVSVGVDEPGYVVSRIRDDGYLRLRTLGGRDVHDDFHLWNEGRPVAIGTRLGEIPGVILINAIHLRGQRPEHIGEQHLWVDIGADSASDAFVMGVELLDPVVVRDVIAYERGHVAAPALGRRAAALALLRVIHELPDDAEGLAFAFVAQSRGGTWVHPGGAQSNGPQGRGGEAVHRRVNADEWLLLGTSSDASTAVMGPEPDSDGPVQYAWMALGVQHVHTPIETVRHEDLATFTGAVYAEVMR